MESTDSRVIRVICEQLGLADVINLQSNLGTDLGADSLDRVELILAIEDEFSIEIPDEDAEPLATPQDIIDYVRKRT